MSAANTAAKTTFVLIKQINSGETGLVRESTGASRTVNLFVLFGTSRGMDLRLTP